MLAESGGGSEEVFMTEDASCNELRMSQSKHGGFVFVDLYDADDHDKFQLGEDEIVALHKYLSSIIVEHNL